MSVLLEHTVRCACGGTVTAQLADTINAARSPALKSAILEGALHRAECARCRRDFTVEKPFIYVDLPQDMILEVFPRGQRHMWREASARLGAAASLIPQDMKGSDRRIRRVVFGMDELREKLIANDAGLDDRVVELTKVLLINEHPFLLQKPRLRIILREVNADDLLFHVAYEHHPEQFELTLARDLVGCDEGARQTFENWVVKSHNANIFAADEEWINIWRWSPQPAALRDLMTYASAIRRGGAIDTGDARFTLMLSGLPRGAHLPTRAKADLSVVFSYAKQNGEQALQDQLFEIRFGHKLEDDWSLNDDPDDIDTLWKLLRDLPDNNVEGNAFIREILLDEGRSGGWYSPNTYDIAIGEIELNDQSRFENVVRHEVGHAVHEQKDDLVNAWLETRFGWRILGATHGGIDAWIDLMGGWGDASARERADIRDALRRAVGRGGSWSPGPAPRFGPGHIWNTPDFGPRLAFERTGSSWYQNFRTWHRHNGKAFFMNFWYRTLLVIDDAALDLVARMPSPYAAMSHYEFFAELYALYFDDDDPSRDNIPADVMAWFAEHIEDNNTPRPAAKSARPRRAWEDADRPESPDTDQSAR